MGLKDEFDRFYTKPDIAATCISHIDAISNLASYDAIVEPSAGSGSFVNAVIELDASLSEKLHAYDILPESGGIIEKSFYDVTHDEIQDDNENGRTLVVGNPPFGFRSAEARRFIRHAIHVLDATTVAFILPNTFSKRTNQRCFPESWRLVEAYPLPRECFTFDGESYHVPCSLFVWTRDDDILPQTNMRETKPQDPQEFRFLRQRDMNADFCLNGNSGKINDIHAVNNPKSEHYIKVNDGYDVDYVKSELAKIKWNFISSCNGGNAWVGRDEISREWHRRNS